MLHRLRGAGGGEELKSVLVTSAMLSEGKSTIISFLAITAASQRGIKTLLIDADLRRPAIHKFFAMERGPGLADILEGKLKAVEAVRKTSLENLQIVTAGRPTEHPSEVFDAEAIAAVVDEMKFYYDLILVDSAPILPVSDPMLLSSRLDAILLVVKAGATQREIVDRAVDILSANRHRILGVILNNMNNSLPYYYDYKYYGYDYSPGKDEPATQAGGPPSIDAGPGQKKASGKQAGNSDSAVRKP